MDALDPIILVIDLVKEKGPALFTQSKERQDISLTKYVHNGGGDGLPELFLTEIKNVTKNELWS